MDESRVCIFSQTPKEYNIMKIYPPIDLKIHSWNKPMLYNDGSSVKHFGAYKMNPWKKRRSFPLSNRSNRANTPLILSETTSIGKNNNKFIGRKESLNQSSNYYILGKTDRGYEAFPVIGWYNFSRGVNFRYLNEDEAEEKYKSRNTILNHSMMMKDLKPVSLDHVGGEMPNSKEVHTKESDLDSESSIEGGGMIKRTSKLHATNFKSSDSEAFDELDEGEFESKELEYFSDTPPSSDTEQRHFSRSSVNTGDLVQKFSEPDDVMCSLPKGLAENGEMFASTSSSSDDQLSSQGKAIKAIMGSFENSKETGQSSSDKDLENFEFSSTNRENTILQSQTKVDSLKHECFSKKRVRTHDNSLQCKRFLTADSQLIEEEVLKYLARGPMNSKTLVKKLKRKLPEMHPESFLRNISDIMKSCNVEKHQTKDGKVIFKLS